MTLCKKNVSVLYSEEIVEQNGTKHPAPIGYVYVPKVIPMQREMKWYKDRKRGEKNA